MLTNARPPGLLDGVCAAAIPERRLDRLAALRTRGGIRVRCACGVAWLSWLPDDVEVLACVLSIPQAELYVRREAHWYRLGSRLPAFDVQLEAGMVDLERVLVPEPREAAWPAAAAPLVPVPVRLVKGAARQRTSAVLARLSELAAWSERMTSHALASLRALHCGEEVLLIGRPLPALAGGRRFWGTAVFVPVGCALEPALPEKALRAALGIQENELLLFDENGAEVLPGDAFEPLTRGSIKRAAAVLGEPGA